MTIRQVIDLAKSSELTGLPVASKDETVLGFINLGVLELYKRFTLKVEEWLVALEDNESYYTAPEDFMWIIAAYGEVGSDSVEQVNILPVNEEDNPLSINTVGWNKIQVPLSVTGAYISIIYAATPKHYGTADINDTIDIPPQVQPISHYHIISISKAFNLNSTTTILESSIPYRILSLHSGINSTISSPSYISQ